MSTQWNTSQKLKKKTTKKSCNSLDRIKKTLFSVKSESDSRSVVFNSLQPHGACQAPLSKEFSRPESWSGLSFLSPGGLPEPGIKPHLLHCRSNPISCIADSLLSEPPGVFAI